MCEHIGVQVLVDRDGDEQDQEMAVLGPGKLLQVSNVVGRGFSSLFNSYVGLMSAMEESRNLLLIGVPPSPLISHLHEEAHSVVEIRSLHGAPYQSQDAVLLCRRTAHQHC
jgi:hypothetical protein